MTEFIYLTGSEDVVKAGNAMREAAQEMNRAASNIDESLRRLIIDLDNIIGPLIEELQRRVT